jgi:hypothetical protein
MAQVVKYLLAKVRPEFNSGATKNKTTKNVIQEETRTYKKIHESTNM